MKLSETPIVQRYAKGDVIVSEGIMSNNAYIVLKGKVSVSKKVDKKNVVISTLEEGSVFGEMGLIANSVRSANVVADDDVTIGVISKDVFETLLADIPEDLRAIIFALVDRLRYTTEQMTRLGVELEKTRGVIQSFSFKHM